MKLTARMPDAGESVERMNGVTVRLNDVRRAGMIDFVDRKILIKPPPTPTELATA